MGKYLARLSDTENDHYFPIIFYAPQRESLLWYLFSYLNPEAHLNIFSWRLCRGEAYREILKEMRCACLTRFLAGTVNIINIHGY
jgi:hypothetical protein